MNNGFRQQKSKGAWYLWIIRLAAGLSAPVLWYVSFQFSVKGFVFLLPEYKYIGQIFGIIFTILELMFNRGVSKHPTLFFAGLFAYTYSIITNGLGLFAASDLSVISGVALLAAVVVLVICAFGLDILPESMLVWSFYPDQPLITGDFVSSVMSGISRRENVVSVNKKSDFGRQEAPIFDARQTNSRQTIKQTRGQTEKMVREYVFRNRQSNGAPMSVRDVASAIGKDRSVVGAIMTDMRRRGEIK